jgi:hypothetical protein
MKMSPVEEPEQSAYLVAVVKGWRGVWKLNLKWRQLQLWHRRGR